MGWRAGRCPSSCWHALPAALPASRPCHALPLAAPGSEAPAGSTDGGDRAGGSTLQSVDEEGALAGSRAGRGDSQLPASPFASAARQGSPIGGSPPGLSSLPEGGEASLGFGVGPGDDSFVVRSPPSVAALGERQRRSAQLCGLLHPLCCP